MYKACVDQVCPKSGEEKKESRNHLAIYSIINNDSIFGGMKS